eukprot:TRINITY_DN6527_c0_g1_i1.p1 TRINITY_DN6527_c0_g1~~TRINITY_DN6527_c0_g1_i1.p1  ORF type:complete len:622 (+),score=74.32 TRINITY_DN6527_c0_g1_i1:35-1900(+)
MQGPTTFADNFWGENGLATLRNKVSQGERSSNNLHHFFVEFARLQAAYTEGLERCVRKYSEKVREDRTLQEFWSVTEDQIKTLATNLIRQTVFIKNKIVLPLQVMERDNSADHRESFNHAKKLLNHFSLLKYQTSKARGVYNSATKNYTETEAEVMKKSNPTKKLQRELAAAKKIQETAEDRYKQALKTVSSYHPVFIAQLQSVYSGIQETEVKRATTIYNLGLSFVDSFTNSKDFIKETLETVHEVSQRVDIDNDLSEWVEKNSKGKQQPAMPVFHPYEDPLKPPKPDPSVCRALSMEVDIPLVWTRNILVTDDKTFSGQLEDSATGAKSRTMKDDPAMSKSQPSSPRRLITELNTTSTSHKSPDRSQLSDEDFTPLEKSKSTPGLRRAHSLRNLALNLDSLLPLQRSDGTASAGSASPQLERQESPSIVSRKSIPRLKSPRIQTRDTGEPSPRKTLPRLRSLSKSPRGPTPDSALRSPSPDRSATLNSQVAMSERQPESAETNSNTLSRSSISKLIAKNSAKLLGKERGVCESLEELNSFLETWQASHPVSPRSPLEECDGITWVCALFDYQGEVRDELTFKQGDVVKLIRKDQSGWWFGESKGVSGIFPANYVEELGI